MRATGLILAACDTLASKPKLLKASRRAILETDRQTKMILTNCAACAAPLTHDHRKRCSRCKTRYEALYKADGATLDDLREAVTTLEDAGRIARRVFGGAYPITVRIEESPRDARAASSARETPSDS